jgi:cell division septum initiation protein DivIVA
MTIPSGELIAEFPMAVRGYSRLAVDDFVRQMGQRLQLLEERLNEQTDRAERLTKELDTLKKQHTQELEALTVRLTSERKALDEQLEAVSQDLAMYIEKEAAISGGIIAVEQRRVAVERELEIERTNTQLKVEQILADAQSEADEIVNEAKHTSEELLTLAEAACALQEERLRNLCREYDETAARIRRTLEAHLSLLPNPGEILSSLSIGSVAAVTASNTSEMAVTTVSETEQTLAA